MSPGREAVLLRHNIRTHDLNADNESPHFLYWHKPNARTYNSFMTPSRALPIESRKMSNFTSFFLYFVLITGLRTNSLRGYHANLSVSHT